jgi:hypothetical protein
MSWFFVLQEYKKASIYPNLATRLGGALPGAKAKLSGAADQPHFEDTDLGNRTIQWRTAGLYGRDRIHNIQAFHHLPEYRVLLVQMWCAAKLPIYGTLVHGDFSALQTEFFHGVETGVRESLSLDDIELATAACTGRIDIVPRSGRSKGASFMEKGRSEFGRNRITGTPAAALAQGFAGISVLAVRIAALDHEIADHPMKKQAVIVPGPGKSKEIVPVLRCRIRQPDDDDTLGGCDLDVFFQIIFPKPVG